MRFPILFILTLVTCGVVHGQQVTALSNHRTTAGPGGSRWYSYADYLEQFALVAPDHYITAPFLWNDTSSQNVESGVITRNHLISAGAVLEPWSSFFNDAFIYWGEIAVLSTDSFLVDSVDITGIYGRNPSITDTDTIVLSVVFGNGLITTNAPVYSFTNGSPPDHSKFPNPQYFVDSLPFLTLWHDSLNNSAYNKTPTGTVAGPAPRVLTIKLGPGNVNDTNSNGFFHKKVSVGTPISVPAGNCVGMSATFKCGDPTAPHMPPGSPGFGDTVYTAVPGNLYKHSSFRPLVIYNYSGGILQYPQYYHDYNLGLYKTEPSIGWSGLYEPMWIMDTANGPSMLQVPYFGFHIVCSDCYLLYPRPDMIDNKSCNNHSLAYPNPADNQLTISFSLPIADDVTITLTNILGQVVAQHNIKNEKDHKEVINTTLLPDGVYIYNVAAKNASYTGHISVLHQ